MPPYLMSLLRDAITRRFGEYVVSRTLPISDKQSTQSSFFPWGKCIISLIISSAQLLCFGKCSLPIAARPRIDCARVALLAIEGREFIVQYTFLSSIIFRRKGPTLLSICPRSPIHSMGFHSFIIASCTSTHSSLAACAR